RDTWPYVGGEDALGLTRLRFNPDTGEIYDSDIEVNTVTEPLSVGEPNAGAVDLDSLLTHEAGHLLGLAHTLEAGATMLAGYKLGSIELRSLAPDDVAGLCSIYAPKRQVSSTSCEPRHGFSDLCGADQPLKPPDTPTKSEPAASSCSFSSRGTSSVGAFALSLLFAFGLRRRRRFVAASLTGAALAGCSLDTRQLKLTNEAGGQTSAGFPSTPDAGETGGRPGQDVDASTGPAMIDGCIDLDEDGIADCDETLVQNATFDTDVDAWHADGAAELTWDERNAADDLPSGSALLEATGSAAPGAQGSATQSASQCSKVTGKRLVTVYANAFVDSDRAGQARVDVQFFDTDSCTGGYSSNFVTPQPLDAENGQWLALKAGSVSGVNTRSVLVRLVVSRPLDEASVRARFDNVLLKATEIE
ncbi:MAG TPA: matrixin family metalloprotease, partial [Polyangiaceae bacterium]|nr:matrixin family metalloprotease [Polyangiaceae bacterium]